MLNPLQHTEANIMDDTDLAGPLVFCVAFGGFLLLVSDLIKYREVLLKKKKKKLK